VVEVAAEIRKYERELVALVYDPDTGYRPATEREQARRRRRLEPAIAEACDNLAHWEGVRAQRGWSRSNLLYMRRAAEAWPTEEEFVHHVGGRLPWRHVTVLLDRLKTREERDWYAASAAEYGWSRAVLEHQIKADLRRAVGAAPTNFTDALEAPDFELAQQLVKDPYVFEHLGLVERIAERDVEQALMDRPQDTMLELGRGMAFVGRQVRLTVRRLSRTSSTTGLNRPGFSGGSVLWLPGSSTQASDGSGCSRARRVGCR